MNFFSLTMHPASSINVAKNLCIKANITKIEVSRPQENDLKMDKSKNVIWLNLR
jgi:hypothetical protein